MLKFTHRISPSKRIVLNTMVQYIRTVFSILISLFSTRLILEALGVNDYGIYTLIAGLVLMLSFITNALTTTTQRYISFYMGEGRINKSKELFNTTLILHIFLGLFIAIIIEILGFFFIDGFLNIPYERIIAAKIVFHFATLMLIISFVTAPFRALLIAHENIIFISIIDFADSILKLVIALSLIHFNTDKLIIYGILMTVISIFNFTSFAFFGYRNYEECTVPDLNTFNKKQVLELTSFAGWTIYSTGCIIGRTQGVAILINKFFGTIVNASFGIALQINASLNFMSRSLLNSMNPQIMKSEGEGNREKMLRLSEILSKFSFLLLAMIVIPSIFEMNQLLKLWLKNVPQYTEYFCQMMLVAAILDQITIGLGSANQAIGNIRLYSIVVNTTKLLTVPVAFISLKLGYSIYSIMYVFVGFELICSVSRLIFLKNSANISISGFINRVFLKAILPTLTLILTCWIIVSYFNFNYRFIVTFISSSIAFSISIYLFGLCNDEKNFVKSTLINIWLLILKKRKDNDKQNKY